MIQDDFIYEWDGTTDSDQKPVCWSPGRYRVRILKLGEASGNVRPLFPVAVVFKALPTRAILNTSLKPYIHNFADIMAPRFGLDISRTLWVSIESPIMVAHLTPNRKLSDRTLYACTWRPVRPNELALIHPDIQGM